MFNFTINIDMSDRSYRLIGGDEFHLAAAKETDAFALLQNLADLYLKREDCEAIKTWLQPDHIAKLLADTPVISRIFFNGDANEWIHSTFMITDTGEDGNIARISCGFETLPGNVDPKSAQFAARNMQAPCPVLCRSDGDDEIFEEKSKDAIRQLMSLMIKNGGKKSSIDELVKYVGLYFEADRAYIFEEDPSGLYTVNTYEWCASGVNPEIDHLQKVPIEVVDPWYREFENKGSFFISCDDEYAKKEPIVFEVLEPQNISCLMAAPLIHEGKIIGFIGVDNPKVHFKQELFLTIAASVINLEVMFKNEHDREVAYQEELRQSSEAEKAANNAKTAFLFNMSHDIRTPINAIMGFRNLLEKHQDDAALRTNYLQKIQEASNVLLSIINNILEMARIEKGTVQVNETLFPVLSFFGIIENLFHDMMRDKGIAFTSQIDVQHPYIYGDTTKLREIFCNLLSNAYKYTRTGGTVKMTVREIPSIRDGRIMLQTTISDTGIGMSESFLPRIFDEFSRENNTTDSKVEGTGLGMPIVKRLVEMMDGSIEIKSKIGEGSAFTVTTSHRIGEQSKLKIDAANIAKEVDLKGKRILLVEDNDLNAEISLELLREDGFLVERAEDGRICVDMLQKAPSGYYDAILMDIQMPNMNGYEATQAIRSLENSEKRQIKIIAMTANAFEEDKKRAFEAGMNAHLSKPFVLSELKKTLSVLLSS